VAVDKDLKLVYFDLLVLFSTKNLREDAQRISLVNAKRWEWTAYCA